MRPEPAQGWRVAIEAHRVGRWTIEKQVLVVRAVDQTQARLSACRQAHRRAGVAPWRPWLRASYLRSKVLGHVADGRTRVGGRRR
jgi:hypothetical protein